MAMDAGYQVNIDDFDSVQLSMFDVIRAYISKNLKTRRENKMQIIYYGAPGTGKVMLLMSW